MTKIFVMSRREAEKVKKNNGKTIAIISITDPGSEVIAINNKLYDDILKIQFYDLEEPIVNYTRVLSSKDSNKIAKFAFKHWNNTECLIVQCEAGISRSAGIAGAISKFFTGNDDKFFKTHYVPNMRCYRMVLDSLINCDQNQID